MLLSLNEPNNFRYIYINPESNHVHLLVPFIAGTDVSTDNTCQSNVELRAFFEGEAFRELNSYKSTLEFHLLLLEEKQPSYRKKKNDLNKLKCILKLLLI